MNKNQKSEVRNQKSLDEVIEALEYCRFSSDCTPCAYKETKDCQRVKCADAVCYLKQYRSDKLEWEADRKAYQDWIEQYKDIRDKHQQAVIELERKSMVWKPAKGRPAYEKGICNCGYVLSVLQRDFVYCPKCGAKLDWSEK